MHIYEEVLKKVLNVCNRFRKHNASANDLHETIAWAEQEITSFEEKELRKFFTLSESEIDYIRVMNNEIDFMYTKERNEEKESIKQLLPIIDKIERECRSRLNL